MWWLHCGWISTCSTGWPCLFFPFKIEYMAFLLSLFRTFWLVVIYQVLELDVAMSVTTLKILLYVATCYIMAIFVHGMNERRLDKVTTTMNKKDGKFNFNKFDQFYPPQSLSWPIELGQQASGYNLVLFFVKYTKFSYRSRNYFCCCSGVSL